MNIQYIRKVGAGHYGWARPWPYIGWALELVPLGPHGPCPAGLPVP